MDNLKDELDALWEHEDMKGLATMLFQEFGKVNVLMNNAGKNGNARKIDDDRKLWEGVIGTNM